MRVRSSAAEQSPLKRLVEGSSPSGPTSDREIRKIPGSSNGRTRVSDARYHGFESLTRSHSRGVP
jgi:hypothetical protein